MPAPAAARDAPAPVLTCPSGPSDTGAYRLSWTAPDGPDGATFRLTEDGTTIYRGPETASTVTGRGAGAYAYRVALVHGGRPEAWSPACRVTVAPPHAGLAFGLFGVGLLVFAAILAVIVRGHRAHRRGEIG